MLATIIITIPSIGNATLIEILWTLFGLAGMGLVIPNLWASVKNMEVLTRTPQDEVNAAKIILFSRVRRELLRLAKLFAFVIVGVYAMASPSVTKPDKTTIAGLLITAVFFFVSAIIALQSYLDRRESQDVRKTLTERAQ